MSFALSMSLLKECYLLSTQSADKIFSNRIEQQSVCSVGLRLPWNVESCWLSLTLGSDPASQRA